MQRRPSGEFATAVKDTLFGPAAGARLVASVASGPDLVFELIARHQIACDALRAGWIQPADSQQALAGLDAGKKLSRW